MGHTDSACHALMSDPQLLSAVREATAGVFEVVGEIGRNPSGSVVFLARDVASATVVALRLDPAGDDTAGAPQYSLELLQQLDETVPDLESTCPRCGKSL